MNDHAAELNDLLSIVGALAEANGVSESEITWEDITRFSKRTGWGLSPEILAQASRFGNPLMAVLSR